MPHMNINGKNLYYEEHGEGFPVIFSHSFLWNTQMWAPQIEALSKNYRCICIDLWNHCQSDILPLHDYSIEQCAKDYWEFSQALGLKEFAFIGLSVGGMIGAHLALNHPEAVKALALVATFVGEEPEKSKDAFDELLQTFSDTGNFSEDLVSDVAPYFFSPKTYQKNPPIVQDFKKALADMPGTSMPGIVDLGRAILIKRQSLLDRLPELSIPTLVMVGSDDLPRPPSESKLMAEKIKSAKLAIIPDAGHICCLEKPERVTQEIAELLRRI